MFLPNFEVMGGLYGFILNCHEVVYIFYVGMFENNNVCSKLGCTIFVLLKNEFPYFVPAITASLSHYGVMKHPRYGGDMIQLIDL